MSKTSNLPEEIILDILTRLPAKSLGQFRCVSKAWLAMLTTQDFKKAHLKLHKEEEKLLVICPSHSLHTLNVIFQSYAVPRKLNFPYYLDSNWAELVGSCNGLVLAINVRVPVRVRDPNALFLINPTTLEHLKVPKSPLALDPHASYCMYGLGYDESADDYKVVTLSYYDTDNEHEPDIADTFVDVFSLRTHSWRRLESSPYDHAVPHPASGVFLRGFLHWLAWEASHSVIAAFDLRKEKFREIPAPSDLDTGTFVFNKLVVLGGCLCMTVERRDGIDVWMMKEYRVEKSWVKVISANEIYYFDSLKPLWLVEDWMLLEKDGDELTCYDLKEQRSEDMMVADGPAMFGNGWTFVESLISPHI